MKEILMHSDSRGGMTSVLFHFSMQYTSFLTPPKRGETVICEQAQH